jgi:hypothetical protein
MASRETRASAPAVAAASEQAAGAPAGAPAAAAPSDISHEPLPPGSYGSNSPTKAKEKSNVWLHFKRLRGEDGVVLQMRLAGKTHVCIAPRDSDGKPCNHFEKLTRPGGAWCTTVALRHLQTSDEHESLGFGKKHRLEADSKSVLRRSRRWTLRTTPSSSSR